MVVLPTSCSRPKPPCPVADLTRAEDMRTARAALAVAAEAAGMADVPTEVDASWQQWSPGWPGTGTDEFETIGFSRSKLVDFAPLAPPVEALKGEAFDGRSATGDDRFIGLGRGQQRAKVELGLPLRDNPGTGKSWFTISVWTGCRPQ